MQKVISVVVGYAILICCVSCKKNMTANEYSSYVNNTEHGLKKVMQIDGWEFTILYRPSEYVMLMENKGNKTGYNFEARRAELAGTAWFNISIRRVDGQVTPLRFGISSSEEYNERLNYYLNGAIKDISLVYGQDTLGPTSYAFETNYNLTPQETIVAGFILPGDSKFPTKDLSISFVDRVFGNGIVKATYNTKTLKNIPNLIYN
ncbi:MAG: hypothetical protein V4649_02795 [Bacteroidota bacterium]